MNMHICLGFKVTSTAYEIFTVLILSNNMSKDEDQIWNIASRTKITNLSMIHQAWILTVQILSNNSSNFADMIMWLNKSSRNKSRFFHTQELYIMNEVHQTNLKHNI